MPSSQARAASATDSVSDRSCDRPRDVQRQEGAAVGFSVRCIQPHELLVCLTEIEFHRSQVMRAFIRVKGGRRLAVGMRYQPTRSDVVHVVGESPAATDIEVLVVVLGDQPGTGPLTSVVLGVPRPDLDRQILSWGFERELDESMVAGGSVIGDAKVAPNVQMVLDPISPPAQLP